MYVSLGVFDSESMPTGSGGCGLVGVAGGEASCGISLCANMCALLSVFHRLLWNVYNRCMGSKLFITDADVALCVWHACLRNRDHNINILH